MVSGINLGENLTIQDIFASGTVAAALSAALLGIPAIAFSMEIPQNRTIMHGRKHPNFAIPARIAAEILREVLEHGLPKGADLLNVNFPWGTSWRTRVKITSLETRKWRDSVLEREDPRGQAVLLALGLEAPELPKGLRRVRGSQAEGHLHLPALAGLHAEQPPHEFKNFESRIASRLRKTTEDSSSTHK